MLTVYRPPIKTDQPVVYQKKEIQCCSNLQSLPDRLPVVTLTGATAAFEPKLLPEELSRNGRHEGRQVTSLHRGD